MIMIKLTHAQMTLLLIIYQNTSRIGGFLTGVKLKTGSQQVRMRRGVILYDSRTVNALTDKRLIATYLFRDKLYAKLTEKGLAMC